ncbi:MAG TPA: 4-hydroxy-tetrahydrodipicolinate synthase [Acidimicrobiales bacterium]|nr:4-hydroxy-tetrahydrodipicolinate synthase [Acidimicrobiales bacterium]
MSSVAAPGPGRQGPPGRLGRVATAMVTPFDDAGALDTKAAIELADWLMAHGTDTLVLAGSTGEGTSLDDAEKVELWRTVASETSAPVMAGVGTADTRHSVRLAEAAEAAGASSLLVVTPYYSRPPQSGLALHFRAIAGATSLPVYLYDIPIRSGRKIAHETMVELAHEVDNIVGVKDACSDPYATARLARDVPEGFEIYSGEDRVTLPLLSVGAVGAISVESHWAGRLVGRMITAQQEGRVDEARRLDALLIDSHHFQTGDDAPNPIPAKVMMNLLGLRVGQCRLPIGPPPAGLEDRAQRLLADLGSDGPLG